MVELAEKLDQVLQKIEGIDKRIDGIDKALQDIAQIKTDMAILANKLEGVIEKQSPLEENYNKLNNEMETHRVTTDSLV